MSAEKIIQIVAGQSERFADGKPLMVSVLYALTNHGRVLIKDMTGPYRDGQFSELIETRLYDLPERSEKWHDLAG